MNWKIPVDGLIGSCTVDRCRRKEYGGEVKTNKDGMPLWLLRCRLVVDGVPFPIWVDVQVPSKVRPFEDSEDMPKISLVNPCVNVGYNDGDNGQRRRYWSISADGFEVTA